MYLDPEHMPTALGLSSYGVNSWQKEIPMPLPAHSMMALGENCKFEVPSTFILA